MRKRLPPTLLTRRTAAAQPLIRWRFATVWNDLGKQATNQNAAGFDATIGTFVPNTVKIEPMPSKTAADIPPLRPYDYAMVDHKLVIVDPSNKVIADVLME
jgi:hypothetical protein